MHNKSVIKNLHIVLILISLFILVLFLNDSNINSDELLIFNFVEDYHRSNLSILTYISSNDMTNNYYLSHHLFWFFLQNIWFNIFLILNKIIFFYDISFLQNYFMSLYQSIFSYFNFVLLIVYLNKKFKFKFFISFFFSFFFFFSSYLSSFITGSFVESSIISLILLRLYFDLYKNNFSLFILPVIDMLIVASKLYLFVLIILFYFYDFLIKKINIYNFMMQLILFILSLSLFLSIKYSVPSSGHVETTGFIFFNDPILVMYQFYNSFFSFGVGVFFNSIIFFILPVYLYLNFNYFTILKILVFIFLIFLFSSFNNPYGTAGVSGNRYIAPLLIIFIDEFIYVLLFLIKKIKIFPLMMIFFVILNLPHINYRNTLIDNYTSNISHKYIDDYTFPVQSLYFNNIIFSWNILLKKYEFLENKYNKILQENNHIKVIEFDQNKIIPMVGIYRIKFILKNNLENINNYNLKNIKEILFKVYPFLNTLFTIIVLYLTTLFAYLGLKLNRELIK